MDKIIAIFTDFREAENADIEYYRNLDPDKKIEELEIIRQNYLNLINAKPDERRLQRILEVVDRK